MASPRYVSDNARANWSSLVAVVAGVVAVTVHQGSGASDGASTAVVTYLAFWPVFVVVYLVWTHLTYARRGPRALVASTQREAALSRRWWTRLLGYGGASSWTLAAAVVAVVVTVLIAQDPVYRRDWLYVGLGLLCVACSWALMAYAFALQYLRLDSGRRADGTRHVVMELEGDPEFADYLTLAVLLSAMAATVSAQIRSREAWSIVRAHVLLAFTFNSVVVAMMVSLLFGGLGA